MGNVCRGAALEGGLAAAVGANLRRGWLASDRTEIRTGAGFVHGDRLVLRDQLSGVVYVVPTAVAHALGDALPGDVPPLQMWAFAAAALLAVNGHGAPVHRSALTAGHVYATPDPSSDAVHPLWLCIGVGQVFFKTTSLSRPAPLLVRLGRVNGSLAPCLRLVIDHGGLDWERPTSAGYLTPDVGWRDLGVLVDPRTLPREPVFVAAALGGALVNLGSPMTAAQAVATCRLMGIN